MSTRMLQLAARCLRRNSRRMAWPHALLLSAGCHLAGFLLLSLLAWLAGHPQIRFEPLHFELVSISGDAQNVSDQQTSVPEVQRTHRQIVPAERETQSHLAAPWQATTPDNLLQNADVHNSFVALPPEARRIRHSSAPLPVALPAPAPATLPLALPERRTLEQAVLKLAAQLPRRDSTFTVTENGKTYTMQVRHLPAKTPMDLDEIHFQISREEHGTALTTGIRLRRLAFSHFAQFVDYWNPAVALHDDELTGRFHSNSSIIVSRSGRTQPRFRGKVTTSAFEIKAGDRYTFIDRAAVFPAGLETGVPALRVPKNVSQLTPLPDSLVQRFDHEVWITFEREKTFSWRGSDPAPARQTRRLPRKPFLIFGEGKATLHVQGVVHGVVLVCARNKIVITGNLEYATPLAELWRSDDYLGLLSEGNIEIAPAHITGPGDLTIHAALFAKGEFRVRDFVHGHGQARLHLLGSLSAGTLSATEPRYATRIEFDQRFETRRPPHFPMTDRYEIARWDERWRFAGTAAE
ncbi:hypothetical protein HUU39_27475 [candidate division KSB1 bacterium]|nr:hypothetical protein [candidate division KSB1 bacterium]